MITTEIRQRLPLAFLVILLGALLPTGTVAQDQAGRYDVLKGTDGQSSCQLRGIVHAKCSTLPLPGLDSSPVPTVCTCNNVYFNIWSACSYASGNNTLPMFGAWTQMCTNASVDLSMSQATTTQKNGLGIQVPPWGRLAVPGNAAFDLQQAVSLVQLAQRKQWSIFQIALPIVAAIVSILITLLAIKLRYMGSSVIRWRPSISALLPYSTRVKTFNPPLEDWEIDPPPSRASTQNATHTTPTDSLRYPLANRPTSVIVDSRRNNRESTEPGHPSVPSYAGSADGTDSRRQSRSRDSSRPASQALAAMYPFGPEAQKPFTATPLRSHANSSNDVGTSTPNSTDVSSGSIRVLPKRIAKMFKKPPVVVRNVPPPRTFNIDGPGGIASRSTSLSGSSFSATGMMKSMKVNNDSGTMTGTEIDPIHEDDGGNGYHDLGRPRSYSGSFDDNESTNLISRKDKENTGNDDDGHGYESRSAIESVSEVNSNIKIVSPSISTGSHRLTGGSLQSNEPTAPPVSRLPPPPVPPVPKLAAPKPPPSTRAPPRRVIPGSLEPSSPPARLHNMTPIQENIRSEANATSGPSRRAEDINGTGRPMNQNHSGSVTSPSSMTSPTQRQAQAQSSTSSLSRPLPSRSGSGDSTNSFNSRPLPSPASSYSQSQSHARSASHSALQIYGSSQGNSSTSVGLGLNHVRSISHDPHQPHSVQSVLSPVRANDPLRTIPAQQNSLHSHTHSGSNNSTSSGSALVRSFSPLNLYEDPYNTHHRGLSADDNASFYMPDTPMQPQHSSRSGTPTPRNDPAAFYAGPIRGAGFYGGVG